MVKNSLENLSLIIKFFLKSLPTSKLLKPIQGPNAKIKSLIFISKVLILYKKFSNISLNNPFHPRCITADIYFFLCPTKIGQQSAVSTPKIILFDSDIIASQSIPDSNLFKIFTLLL